MTAPLPDWGKPLGAGFWQAHGLPGLAIGLPVALRLEREDGRAGYSLHTWRIAGGQDMDAFGVLTIRFVGDDQEPARAAILRTQTPNIALSFPGLSGPGYCRFTALALLGLPGLDRPAPLVFIGQGLILTQRIAGNGVQLLQAMLHSGGQPVVAEVVTTFLGHAVRASGTARIDGNALAARIATLPGALITRAALIETLRTQAWPDAIVTPQAPDAAACDALADRITAAALALSPPDADASEPQWGLRASALPNATLTLSLNDDTIAPRAVLLRSPALLQPDLTVDDISDPLIVMQTGFAVLTLAAIVPDPRVGADVIGVDIEIPAHPPERPQTIRRSITFDSGSAIATVPVRLAPGEAAAFNYRAFTVAMDGSGSTRRDGPWLQNADTHLSLPARAWPVDFLVAEATGSLLAVGNLALSYDGSDAGTHWHCEAMLTVAQPRVTVARPKNLATVSATCVLISPQGGSPIAVALGADSGDLFLDLAAVPQAGPQTATAVTVGAGPFPALEFAGEDETADPAAIRLVRLRAGDAPIELRWLPTTPFRAGLRCRWATTPPGAWSPALPAGTRIEIHASDAQDLEWPGVASGAPPMSPNLTAPEKPQLDLPDVEVLADGPANYRYRPRAPRLQSGPDGKPAANLIAFGAGLMVQLTAEWTVDQSRLTALAALLENRDGAPSTLTAAGDSVRETALLLTDGATLTTGTALGAPPQTSLLSATLSGDQADLIKRAVGGERGLAIVRYTVDATDPSSRGAAIAIATMDDSSAHFAAASRSGTSSHMHTLISEADLASLMHPKIF